MGFVLHPDHHGQGFATEATREMLRLGFEELGLHRIEGRRDARNTASARVMERLGMRREGLFRENEFVKGEWCRTAPTTHPEPALWRLDARESVSKSR